MIDVEITGDLQGTFNRMADGLRHGMERGIMLGAEIAAGELRRSVQQRFTQHTATFGRSFRATLLEARGATVGAGAFSDLVYARIQELGGEIKPVQARFLTVPLTDQARKLSRAGGSARMLPNTADVQHWAFVKRVRLTGRHYIAPAADAATGQIAIAVGDEVELELEEQV